MMHTYVKNREENTYIYTVGFYSHDGFHTLEDFGNEEEARELVHFLNGGNKDVHVKYESELLKEIDILRDMADGWKEVAREWKGLIKK